MSDTQQTYTVHVKGARKGFSFTLYLDDYPQPIVGGRAPETEFDFDVPSEFTGEGKIKVFGKVSNRALQTLAYSIPVKLSGKDQTIDLSYDVPVTSSTKTQSTQPVEDTSAVETIQDVTKNKLREKIQSKKTGNSFWDSLK